MIRGGEAQALAIQLCGPGARDARTVREFVAAKRLSVRGYLDERAATRDNEVDALVGEAEALVGILGGCACSVPPPI